MATETREFAGWDVGGAHVKAARVVWGVGGIEDTQIAVRPFEIWRGPDELPSVLAEVGDELGLQDAHAAAVTMTAELSDAFRTKREGVLFVLAGMEQAFPHTPLYLLSVTGDFVPAESARRRPLDFAATNWVASALFVAERHPECIMIDVGSTTTDIIPIRGGRIVAEGRTDPSRLTTGELIYTGVLRTNPNTLTETVPVRGRMCRVAAEYFTVMADAYLLLGRLSPEEYTCPTPDGRAASREAAAERLARLVCADREMLRDEEIRTIASYLFELQLHQISIGLLQVLSGLEGAHDLPLVVAGAGSFLAVEVGRRLGLGVVEPAEMLPGLGSTALPAAAAAYLLARRLGEREP
ncbi:MAG: H4MPT-linked C1 transfer pathway protein [Actinobacteria bacterium]|nr:H4MPT-linked C1 transfer pathway protein [Actinomycetota bacterium]